MKTRVRLITSNEMRFLFVSNIFPPHVRGGYELGCQSIALATQALGHEVRVATSMARGFLNKTKVVDSSVPVDYIFEPVFVYEAAIEKQIGHDDTWRFHREKAFAGCIESNARALAALLQSYRPDVIWIFNPLGLGPVGILEAALSWPARCLIHLMDNIEGLIAAHCTNFFSLARLGRLKRHFDAISCSFKIMDMNERHGSYRSHRVIYNGVDFAGIGEASRPEKRERGDPRLVYFGQVERAKGLLHLVEGAARAHQQGCRFQLDIIGTGSRAFASDLEELIDANNLNGVVNRLGFVNRSDLLKALPGYDGAVFLLSDDEPFAYCVIEAAASGLPVILTSKSGNAECFPADYPLFVDDRTRAEDVAQKIKLVCEDQSIQSVCTSLRQQLAAYCDFNSVTMPSYMRTVRTCPATNFDYDLDSALTNWNTVEFHALAH